MYKVLLVEDDLRLFEILWNFLKKSGNYTVFGAHDGASALDAAKTQNFDIVLLDILLPGVDGISVCERLRVLQYCPIIFISCLDDEETILKAFKMGGDDYLVKPFSSNVLLAHMDAMLRRMQRGLSQTDGDITIGSLSLHIKNHILTKDGKEIYLSPTEYALLFYLMNNKGSILKFEEIYQHIWMKPSYGDVRTVFAHVRNLRKKIEENVSEPKYILTYKKMGYVFMDGQSKIDDFD